RSRQMHWAFGIKASLGIWVLGNWSFRRVPPVFPSPGSPENGRNPPCIQGGKVYNRYWKNAGTGEAASHRSPRASLVRSLHTPFQPAGGELEPNHGTGILHARGSSSHSGNGFREVEPDGATAGDPRVRRPRDL